MVERVERKTEKLSSDALFCRLPRRQETYTRECCYSEEIIRGERKAYWTEIEQKSNQAENKRT